MTCGFNPPASVEDYDKWLQQAQGEIKRLREELKDEQDAHFQTKVALQAARDPLFRERLLDPAKRSIWEFLGVRFPA